MSCLAKVSKKVSLIGLLTILTSAICSVGYAAEILKQGYPERYSVKKGDTLWGISGQYLKEPWRWPELWKGNERIENPDLIFPGDVLVLTFVDGKPVLRALKRETVKLKPSIRVQDLNNAIPPFSPRVMKPFLIAPLITTKEEIGTSPYIVDGFNNRLISGKGGQMYARQVVETSNTNYQIFRQGRTFVHPKTKEPLGIEALDIGAAKLAKPGDPAKITIKSSREEVVVLDRLRPVEDLNVIPFFFPSAHPDTNVEGYILRPAEKTPEIGRLDRVIAITFGEREGVKQGQVFKVLSKPKTKVDPLNKKEKFTIPSEEVGLVMVFRVFDKVSYAIVTNTERPLEPGDRVVNPKLKL